jgi:hypothetical protein
VRVEFAFFAIKFLGVTGGIAFDRNVRPFGGIFSVDFEPLVEAGFSVGFNRVSWAFRLTNATVDAFIRVDHQHVFALVKAVHGADFHAIHIFTFDAVFCDDVGHFGPSVLYKERFLAESFKLCTDFFGGERASIEFLVEQPCFGRRAPSIGFGQHFYDLDVIVNSHGQHIFWFYGVGGFGDARAVQANMATFHQLGSQAAVFYKPRINQPFVNPLCQFNPASSGPSEQPALQKASWGPWVFPVWADEEEGAQAQGRDLVYIYRGG